MKNKISAPIHRISEKVAVVVVLLGLAIASVPVQPVQASFEQFAMSILSNAMPITFAKNKSSFPVAGDREPTKTITVVSTAFNSLEGQTDDSPCIPAMSSFNLCDFYEEHGYGNSVAANFLPLGTQVQFPDLYGDKIFVVRDRMNKRYGQGRVDIWLPTYAEAKTFGVKRLKMNIYN